MTNDLETVPLTPVYTITISAAGAAAVNGEQVTEPGLDPNAARVAALAEVRIKAAFHGRPVRALAKEADGSAWPLIVDTDGTVTALDHPHPTPPAPVPAQTRPPTAPSPAATPAVPPTTQEAPPQTAATSPNHAVQTPATPSADRAAAAVPPEWAAPLPPQYAPVWGELVAHEQSGRLVEAIVASAQLESTLVGAFGPLAPPTVNVLTVRAFLTVRRVEESEDWAETLELLVQTAQRRREAGAPEDDTQRVIRNVHAVWMRLAVDDPEYAREEAEPVLVLLGDHPENKRRAQAVIRVLERGAAA
ncbi:hypothetical protein [Streptomyces sp. NPDC046976]|uniref:hypothetical protein n=1 Tax=Streptomyces sp. NPDC046976 TaxID=3155258 RepID=UPI0033DF00B1